MAEKEKLMPAPAALVEIGEKGVMLRSLEDLLRFARLAVAGGAAPKGMSEGAAAMAIQAGLERGLGPLGGLQQCLVINGVLSWRGQGAFSLIQNSAVCKPGSLRFWTEGEGDNMKGVAVAHRIGYKEADRREFTVKDARQARLWGKAGPWTEYPQRQLAWRALGFLARDIFPDVLGGFPLAEEAMDFGPQNEGQPPRWRDPSFPPQAYLDAKKEWPERPPAATRDPLLAALKGEVAKPAEVLVENGVLKNAQAEQDEAKPLNQDISEIPEPAHHGEPAPPPSCQHGTLHSDFCPRCSQEADEAIAAKDEE